MLLIIIEIARHFSSVLKSKLLKYKSSRVSFKPRNCLSGQLKISIQCPTKLNSVKMVIIFECRKNFDQTLHIQSVLNWSQGTLNIFFRICNFLKYVVTVLEYANYSDIFVLTLIVLVKSHLGYNKLITILAKVRSTRTKEVREVQVSIYFLSLFIKVESDTF